MLVEKFSNEGGRKLYRPKFSIITLTVNKHCVASQEIIKEKEKLIYLNVRQGQVCGRNKETNRHDKKRGLQLEKNLEDPSRQ